MEMNACIGPLGELDSLCSKKKVLAKKRQLLNLFLGQADTEPSSPVKLKNSMTSTIRFTLNFFLYYYIRGL